MSDLSQLSDEQLIALYQRKQQAPSPDLSKLSDEELTKLYQNRMTQGTAAFRGAAQGATLGFGDEIAGAVNASVPSQLRMRTDTQPGRPPSQSLVGGLLALARGDQGAKERYAQGRDEQRALDKQAAAEYPITYGAANVAGQVPIALMTGGAGGGSLLGQMAKGAASMAPIGLVQGIGEAETTADIPRAAGVGAVAGALGGAAGPAAARLVGKVISPGTVKPGIDTLSKEGVETTAGQKLGWKWLQLLEDQASQVPGMGGSAGKVLQSQREQLGSAAMAKMGGSGAATADAREAAGKALSNAYDALKARTSVNLDNQVMADLTAFGDWASRNLTDEQINLISKKVQQWGRHGPTMPGEYFKTLSSELKGPGLDKMGQAENRLNRILTDAFRRSVSPGDAAELAQLDKQWLTKKIVNDAMSRPGSVAETGEMAPAALAAAAKKFAGAEKYSLGKGPVTELAQAAKANIPTLANSNTAMRAAILKAVGAFGPGAAVGGASYASGNTDPVQSVALALLGPRLLTSAAGQRLIANQVGRSPGLQAAIARALAVPVSQDVRPRLSDLLSERKRTSASR